MSCRVVFSPEADRQLTALYSYIAAAASPDIAARYTEAIVSHCESLCTFPHRGTMRDDVRPGLRIASRTRPVGRRGVVWTQCQAVLLVAEAGEGSRQTGRRRGYAGSRLHRGVGRASTT
ncbi:MAG: type II toxin-antitoxin system RelE/ParE family toxin [Candidatus Nitrotoga sp.]